MPIPRSTISADEVSAPLRTARGSYSRLKCLQCRSRKIKCELPNLSIEPSHSPQPPETSCTRCHQQGLDCIVDNTVLGRPSHKRRRPATGTASSTGQGDSQSTVPADANEEGEDDVEAFVLSHVESAVDGIDVEASRPNKIKPSRHEVFAALLDSTHLLSALLARDTSFGSQAIPRGIDVTVDPIALVNESLLCAMDEQLAWHRLHYPYLPTLRELRDAFDDTLLHATSTQMLFTVLASIALQRMPGQASLQHQLQLFASQHAQELLFEVPPHRHAMLVLDVASWCAPFTFVANRSSIAAAIKGNLTSTLGKRIAEELGLHQATAKLKALLDETYGEHDATAVESLTLDCLQWCRWIMLATIMYGFVIKPISEQRRPMPEIRSILSTVHQAIFKCRMRPSVVFLFHSLYRAEVEMQAAIDAKKHWLDLASLSSSIDANARKCDELESFLSTLLATSAESITGQEAKAIMQLQATDLNLSHARVGGLALFYGLMSGLHPRPTRSQLEARDITPEDAMQVSSEIISSLKSRPFSHHEPGGMAAFLTQYGDSRFARLERWLRDFIAIVRNLRLHDVPFFPPAVPTVSNVLFICREMVENNATRLKGWGGLHPNVDVHLLLFQDVATSLLAISPLYPNQSDAVTKGCVLAAGAKLVGSLGAILAKWRRGIAERESKETAAANAGKIEAPRSEDFLHDEEAGVLDDWAQWPQAEDMDFATLFADDADWLQWARDLLPTEEDLQSR